MCIDFYGHHSGGSSFVHKMIFVITEIGCILQVQVSALRKNRSIRVPVQYKYIDSTDSLMPRTSVQIRQPGRTGIGGRDNLVVLEQRFRRFWNSLNIDIV